MQEPQFIQTVIQGGAVGIAVLLVLALILVIKWFVKLVSNHINHNTSALTKLNQTIDSNTKSNERSMKVLERVERVLDK